MLTLLGLVLALSTSYYSGRSVTKTEMEWHCENFGRVELAYNEYECKKTRELLWIKELRENHGD